MYVCSSCASVIPGDAQLCPEDGAAAEYVASLPRGARLGSYRLEGVLGEGGMGTVYEAHHEALGRRAALKVLREDLVEDRAVVIRFLQEAKAVNLIRHDHIIDIYDFGDGSQGAVYFVMEYLEGETLGDLLKAHGRLPPPLFAHVFSQILEALAAAHDKDIIHRDLKPTNVFVTEREDDSFFVKLLDFGVAKLSGEGAVPGLTRAGARLGTPKYMSPEQIDGRAIDPRADIFAVGVMMYRAAVGRLPWRGAAFSEIARGICREAHAPPREAAPDADIPAVTAALIDRALAKDPADRYPRAEDMLREVARLVEAYGGPAPAGARAGSGAGAEHERSAVTGDAGASLSASLPEYQGASAKRARPWPYALTAAGVVALLAASAVVFLFARGSASDEGPAGAAGEPAPAAGGEAERPWTEVAARAHDDMAERLDGDRAERDRVMSALAYAGTAASAPLLYRALEGGPQARVRAADILADLELREAAPRIREALARSGDRVRLDLAMALVSLGDEDGVSILESAVEAGDGRALEAAAALAEAGRGDAARAPLEDGFARTPAGRERWRVAARGLVALGDAEARDALRSELAHRDADRSVAAAAILAAAGDDEARELLRRVSRDDDHEGRAAAALALARQDEAAALRFAEAGIESDVAEIRARATAVAAHLAAEGGRAHADDIASLATRDPDGMVRDTAKVALLAFRADEL